MSERSTTFRRRLGLLGLLFAGLGAMTLEPAALANPAKRVEAFRRLPDWSGLWISTSEKPNLSGQYDDISVFTPRLRPSAGELHVEARYNIRRSSSPVRTAPTRPARPRAATWISRRSCNTRSRSS